MMTVFGISFVTLFAVLVAWGIRVERRQRAAEAAAIAAAQAAREPRPLVGDELVAEVVAIIAKIADESIDHADVTIDPQKIRAEDQLITDLGYGMDSVSLLELEVALEKKFHIRITGRDRKALLTVAGVVQLVRDKTSCHR